MTKKTRPRHAIDGLIALLLFGVFAVSILSVLLTGADVYQRLARRDQASYADRTCAQYIATKVRQAPSAAALAVAPFGEADALVLTEEIGGVLYLTRVYCYDGWLWELFSAAQDELRPEDGEQVLPLQGLELLWEDGLLSVTMTQVDGSEATLCLAPRGGEGAAA